MTVTLTTFPGLTTDETQPSSTLTRRSVTAATPTQNSTAATPEKKKTNTASTMRWNMALSLASCLNVLRWTMTVYPMFAEGSQTTQRHVILSGIFTVVCCFRSIVPRVDLERYCIWDSPLSSMSLGRACATVAEISFSCQIALFVSQIGDVANLPYSTGAPLIVVLISIAQCCCWYGVCTLNFWGHVVEESIWGSTFSVITVLLGIATMYVPSEWVTICAASTMLGMVYVVFMFTVDVPMYISKAREATTPPVPFFQGLKDATFRRVVTRDWVIWSEEWPWMTGYFTASVWCSQYLVALSQS